MSRDLNTQLRWGRRLRFVPRWGVMPVIKPQNVAEHSYHVTMLARWLVQYHERHDDKSFLADVLVHALEHDIEEAVTGDIPAPYKERQMDMMDLMDEDDTTSEAESVVKLADVMEALVYLQEEMALGSSLLGSVFKERWDVYLGRYNHVAWRIDLPAVNPVTLWHACLAQTLPDVHPVSER